jgi:RHS repeat-associated protein
MVVADGETDGIYYYHNDHLGTPQRLTDATGTVAWAADYLPFGGVDITVETVENNLRFAGQYYDEETGLHYNYHRYYDPATGRYLTADPIGLNGGINLFAYVSNNPVNFIDPWGLMIGDMPPAPPGYSPTTWKMNIHDYGVELVDPEGNRYLAHPEDKGHWRHWDKRGPTDKGPKTRIPRNSRKPFPNQKRLKDNQNPCDPSGDEPPFDPNEHIQNQFRFQHQYPVLVMPFDPNLPSPVRIPMRTPILRPVFVP